MTRQRNWMQRVSTARTGQGLMEYSLLIGLVAIVSLGGLQLLGKNLSTGVKGSTDNFSMSAAPSASSALLPPTTASAASPDTTTGLPSSPNTNNPTTNPTNVNATTNPSEMPAPTGTGGQTTPAGQTVTGQPTITPPSTALVVTPSVQPTHTTPAVSHGNTSTTTTPPTTAVGATPASQPPTTEQSAWANSTNQCVGCTANMNGDWGW